MDPTSEQRVRFGFTATKKIGGAVERNRIRRRLRELVRIMPNNPARAGCDYVIVARREVLSLSFDELAQDLRRAISNVHATLAARRMAAPNPGARSPARSVGEKDQADRS